MDEKQLKKQESIISTFHKGVVCESREQFDKSPFNKVYLRASKLVQESVREQESSEETYQVHERPDNIITFIGRRGTGKSSVMKSFMEGLQENSRWERESKYRIVTNNGGAVNFIAVDWIDASMLEKGEDIFETILAKMLGELLQEEEKYQNLNVMQEYEMRDLHNSFGSIYKKVLNLKKRSESRDYSGESAISTLRELARSNELRMEFEKLIPQYIEVKKKQCGGSRQEQYAKTFLVLAIDDVDMNVDFGFEILDKIQRYLKVKGLIVLLAINYEQMKICCEKRFARVFSDYTRNLSGEKQDYVTKIAEEYTEKVLPSYMRVYLPSLKKKDYDRERLTSLEISMRGGDKKTVPIKKGVFLLAEQKTMVRYDGQGKKRHFMEPDTLRNLNNNCVFYMSMDTVKESDEDFLEKLDFNIRRSMDDLLFRFAFEHLPDKERKILTRLSEEDIRRRGEIIVSTLLKEVNRKDKNRLDFFVKKDNEKSALFDSDCRLFGYSYGELMRSFYFYGREEIFDKKLVHGFLAMYSLSLTKIFYRYKKLEAGHAELSLDEKRNYRILKEIMNGSAAGSWALYIMPKVITSELEAKIYYSGAVKSVQMKGIYIPVDNEREDMNEMQKDRDSVISVVANEVDGMKYQMILLLFLSGYRTEEPFEENQLYFEIVDNYIKEDAEQDDYAKCRKQEIGFKNVKADYNVMNFVNNIFIFDEIMDNMIKAVCLRYKESILKDVEKPEEQVKKKLKEDGNSFYAQMTKWTMESGGMVLPIYAADIYYNMLKRIARELKRNPEGYIGERELFIYLQKLMVKIEKHLAAADKIYGEEHFQNIWNTCPVIMELKAAGGNSKMANMYNKFVSDMLRSEHSESYKWTEAERVGPYLD